MSATTIYCQWEDETARDKTAEKGVLHTIGWLRTSLSNFSLSSLLRRVLPFSSGATLNCNNRYHIHIEHSKIDLLSPHWHVTAERKHVFRQTQQVLSPSGSSSKISRFCFVNPYNQQQQLILTWSLGNIAHYSIQVPKYADIRTFRGNSIYDVHKKIRFSTPLPLSTWAGPPPPLWTSTYRQHETSLSRNK